MFDNYCDLTTLLHVHVHGISLRLVHVHTTSNSIHIVHVHPNGLSQLISLKHVVHISSQTTMPLERLFILVNVLFEWKRHLMLGPKFEATVPDCLLPVGRDGLGMRLCGTGLSYRSS